MRLWHYKLLPAIDNKHLVSQWRECIAIKRQWQKGTLKHRLVSYVMDYDKEYFLSYVCKILDEMDKRKINWNPHLYLEIIHFCGDYNPKKIFALDVLELNYPEHNDRYLRECLYNLEEKAMRGIINKEKWQKIYDKFRNFTDLWKGE